MVSQNQQSMLAGDSLGNICSLSKSGLRDLLSRVQAGCSIIRWCPSRSKPGSCDVCAVVGREWMWALPVALCNPLPVWPLFQVLVTNGWFQSSTSPWRTSFRVSYGSLRFVTTPILAPKNGSGWDWQNPSCCPNAKSWGLDALVTCPGCARWGVPLT